MIFPDRRVMSSELVFLPYVGQGKAQPEAAHGLHKRGAGRVDVATPAGQRIAVVEIRERNFVSQGVQQAAATVLSIRFLPSAQWPFRYAAAKGYDG